MSINIVLVEPEIPQNTGNIARTCAALGAPLHLIEPLGFSIDEKSVKRAGLDYWHLLKIHRYDNLEDFFEKNPEGPYRYITTKGVKNHTQTDYPDGTFLIFGKETKGLPEKLLTDNPEKCFRIPMKADARSLNLSNAVAICAYEAMAQQNFPGLLEEGPFPG